MEDWFQVFIRGRISNEINIFIKMQLLKDFCTESCSDQKMLSEATHWHKKKNQT